MIHAVCIGVSLFSHTGINYAYTGMVLLCRSNGNLAQHLQNHNSPQHYVWEPSLGQINCIPTIDCQERWWFSRYVLDLGMSQNDATCTWGSAKCCVVIARIVLHFLVSTTVSTQYPGKVVALERLVQVLEVLAQRWRMKQHLNNPHTTNKGTD